MGSASAPVVRVPTNEPVIIKRLLDIGFYNFLIPFVETKEEAEQAVASTRYPPEGTRMVAMGQSNALAVMAFAPRDSLLHAPDMYMKKLVLIATGTHFL